MIYNFPWFNETCKYKMDLIVEVKMDFRDRDSINLKCPN